MQTENGIYLTWFVISLDENSIQTDASAKICFGYPNLVEAIQSSTCIFVKKSEKKICNVWSKCTLLCYL